MVDRLDEETISRLEREHEQGLASAEILAVLESHGVKFSEATLRKYVQLGLLPRSVRVGRKGKHRGSLGLYPASAVRQLEHIRKLMSQGFTMEEIQREFLFVRGELEELSRTLERLYAGLERALESRGGDELAERKLTEAREAGADLMRRLDEIEQRMSMRARMQRAHV